MNISVHQYLSFTYISRMKERHPTYRLGPDFQPKLAKFVEHFVAEGFEIFAEEFSRIDAFVERARKESDDRDAHDHRF